MKYKLIVPIISIILIFTNVSITNVFAAGDGPKPPEHDWSFYGIFGTFERDKLQRGFKVYQEVCASCHSLKYISFRNLVEIGFTVDEATFIASQSTVPGGVDDVGDPFERSGRLADPLPKPFPNDSAARAANGGALPPDLSLITKNRNYGPDYILALLTGYIDPPSGYKMSPGMSYNKYYPGHQIAMTSPLSEGVVEYPDGTEASVQQMSEDVVHFLHWAANPELEERHSLGLQVMTFLAILTILFWFVKRAVWRKLDH
ncbi:cytochrome c1 [Alphaproteobacteria bacterium]|nr:cytochrome c1 [Alphaproteobacteria bacterium]